MIKIYGTPGCSACIQAVSLCKSKSLDFSYIDMMEDPGAMDTLMSKIGSFRSVPQITMDEEYVGGLAELIKKLN